MTFALGTDELRVALAYALEDEDNTGVQHQRQQKEQQQQQQPAKPASAEAKTNGNKEGQAGANPPAKGGKGGGKKPAAAPAKEVRPWTEELQTDYDRILTVGEECVSPPELKTLLTAKGRGSNTPGFNLYDGFEPSGRMHIAQGVFKAMNVNKCTAPGTNSTFVFWVADWFALMNDKMGGDLDKIKTVGHYLIEVWKAAGMDLSNVVFKWASEEITNQADKYWPTMLDVARRFNVTRIKKCCQIMGRLEGSLTAAQILYPLMQCTDVFFLRADICQLGVDQRKVNMLAREYCDAANIKHKPIILSHHMLYGLKAGQEKMSKSDPDSAIFMEDAAADVERKIMNAYCPSAAAAAASTISASDTSDDAGRETMNLSGDTLKNPCLDYIQHIIFSPPGATFTAGGKTFEGFDSVRQAFLEGKLSEEQLKQGLISELNRLLEPVRTHFSTDERAKDLLAKVQQYKKEATNAATSASKKAAVVRRLNLVQLKKVPAGSHLVFAPLPTATPTLQHAVDLLTQLRSGGEAASPRVLFLSDWTARVCNACLAEAKAISAFYTVLIETLKALDPSVMENTQVLLQSEAILADPSNYWISVINAGRHFMLNEVMGSSMVDSDNVGNVIGRLMRVADVAGVEPKTIALSTGEPSEVEKTLISNFIADKMPGVTIPTIDLVVGAPIQLQKALTKDNDQYFLLDPKTAGASKMKKAFCEPLNINFCPPIEFARVFVFGPPLNGTLTVKRDGGDKVYASAEDVKTDFASGALHPSELKPPLTAVAAATLEKIVAALNKGEAKKATGALKNLQKKMAKQKK